MEKILSISAIIGCLSIPLWIYLIYCWIERHYDLKEEKERNKTNHSDS